ncbi:membrane-bound PQQ-dependent dehydrogenase, glucose/quinate/shikimate family [Polaromonas sp. CF318]|uniref:glucose/quinate/shikimate family membrane-bound PQQ-dependent dehydrogenase n=1 Tax=Polaromonas sp. CF318 TaxID=1144318 RepID=UPI0002713602|nr:glucose/quinate/shikimate family membrane-bound PQQ-dependent dehydrogenase [Polaromonas sp. CF318]EJL77528.1 membrane-bound PQQ-dependent dehydrogenase, glucose/quinate/shikimate family [Polaromonas sp. CF318]
MPSYNPSPVNPALKPVDPLKRRTAWAAGLLLLVLGVPLLLAGCWLVVLGGTSYYLLAGLGFVLAGVLLARRSPAGLWVFALVVGGTLAWALWEAGLDWWPLAARGGMVFVIGLFLLTPRVARTWPIHSIGHEGFLGARGGRWALGSVLGAFLVAAVVTWFHDDNRLVGMLPLPPMGAGTAAQPADTVPADEWHAYGRSGLGQRYSPLAQITPDNVKSLQVAWEYRTGDVRGRPGDPKETTFEVTPLKVGNRLFFCTPHQSVIALDATTGAEIWRFNPEIRGQLALQHLTCRGLSYQPPATAPKPPAADGCTAKLFMPTADGRVIALSPESGKPCTSFGGGKGQIDLWANMPNLKPGAYYSTSPVVVSSRLLIVGGTVLDNVSTQEQSGVIRAFDINTGALVWAWDSGRPDSSAPLAPGQAYTANSPNSWSISSVDEALGMVYVPLGNQPPDQWGGNRSPAVETYSSSVVALDLATGKVRWNFQTVHHDLWDYDVPAQPSLLDLNIGGNKVPALVQPTKQGEIFVLDRRTGVPLLPITEVPAPQGAAQGDRSASTQPKSALSFNPPPLTGRDMWGATMFDQLYCRIAFQRLRYEGRFTPPSTQGTLVYPGNFGVFNWGGVAVDPVRQMVFSTPTYLAFVSKLVPRTDDTTLMVQGKQRPEGSLPSLNENFGAPFAVKLSAFLSPLGIPCQAPPWGYVAGADLITGTIAWQHKNGTVRDLSPVPLPLRMGVPSLGGPLATAGGVAFLSGTLDDYVRAYDVNNGDELWKSRLPAGGQATPMSYTGADGRQYVLVVAGGHGSLGTRAGDYVRAYALPRGG